MVTFGLISLMCLILTLDYRLLRQEPSSQPCSQWQASERIIFSEWAFRPAILILVKAFCIALLSVHLSATFLFLLPKEGSALGTAAVDFANTIELYGRFESEVLWGLSVAATFCLITWLEFNWILKEREAIRERLSRPNCSKPFGTKKTDNWYGFAYSRQMERLTVPWRLYSIWLPTLTVEVNLGIDTLDHTDVIRSMLVGLRHKYEKTFTSWTSWTANVIRILTVILALGLARIAADHWFDWPRVDENRKCSVNQPGPPMPEALKETLPEAAINILHWPIINLSGHRPTGTLEDRSIRRDILSGIVGLSCDTTGEDPRVAFRVYNLFLIVLLFWAISWLRRRPPFAHYGQNLREIEELIDMLTTTVRARQSDSVSLGNRTPLRLSHDESFEKERQKVDGHTLELRLLALLTSLQNDISVVGLTVPAPEFIFVFDELDKVGGIREEDIAKSIPGLSIEPGQPGQELKRSQRVWQLLYDMKRVLSSGPGRFIFVGGRLLYDEWLADQVARHPILSNIFRDNIHLSSLLVDRPFRERRENPDLKIQVYRFLNIRLIRANELHSQWEKARHSLFLGRLHPATSPGTFLSPATRASLDSDYFENKIEVMAVPKGIRAEKSLLVNEFVDFLTYRSAGNPKRLKDLLLQFIADSSSVESDADNQCSSGSKDKRCSYVDILRFSETELFRIQLASHILTALIREFGSSIQIRDDKICESIFYFTDYMFKFHRRAFSLANVERIDEFEHVHRAPDVREVFQRVVSCIARRYLQPVLNGMYDFRFRSAVAKEIEYISRQSPQEMAAYNFTLNESQVLKEIYLDTIKGQKVPNFDVVAGLGELLDYDQEYDEARHYYREAISLIDVAAGSKAENWLRPMTNPDIIDLHWAVIRVRLMLQIGTTFEQENNFERAEIEYRGAYILAWNVIMSYSRISARGGKADRTAYFRLFLKHLSLFYQPSFALAWISEKTVGDIDSSTAFIEQELAHFRQTLPVLLVFSDQIATAPHDGLASNFRLVGAELHSKAGDLLFHKGRQFLTMQQISTMLEDTDPGRFERASGYLLRAYYHYATALYELRNYSCYRHNSASVKYAFAATQTVMLNAGQPQFIHMSAANTFHDISCAVLGRLSLFGLINADYSGFGPKLERWNCLERNRDGTIGDFHRFLMLDGDTASDAATFSSPMLGLGLDRDLGPVTDWLGRWSMEGKGNCLLQDTKCAPWPRCDAGAPRRCAEFGAPTLSGGKPNEMWQRLLFSLKAAIASAHYMESAGYPEQAADKFVQVSEAVGEIFWWLASLRWLSKKGKLPSNLPKPGDFQKIYYWQYIFAIGVEALAEARNICGKLYCSEAQGPRHSKTARSGAASVSTLAASLWLVGKHAGFGQKKAMRRLASLSDLIPNDRSRSGVRRALSDYIAYYRYPLLVRLRVLKVLADDAVLSDEIEAANNAFDEMHALALQYDSPIHFTPLFIGHSAALLQLSGKLPSSDRDFRKIAEAELQKSREMYTLGDGYYQSVAGLYFLFDDYNDREVSFNHALQMAGMEFTSLLLHLLDQDGPARATAPG